MSQPVLPKVNWLSEAWAVAELLDRIPSYTPKALQIRGFVVSEVDCLALQKLRNKLGDFVVYRLQKSHKAELDQANPFIQIFDELGSEPDGTKLLLDNLVAAGCELTTTTVHAIQARRLCGKVLKSYQLADEWKQIFALVVASVGGKSRAYVSQEWAAFPRKRTNELRAAKLHTRDRHPGLNWKDILRRLEGDGIVTMWDMNLIHWTCELGKNHVCSTGTFKNWKRE